jgi:3-methyladenine DNA glycosylase AlkD
MIEKIKEDFDKIKSNTRATHSARFFKTGPGEYSEGDIFIGAKNPDVKKLVNKYKKEITLEDTLYFLKNKIHSYRFFALEVLKYKYEKGDENNQKEIIRIYLDNIKHINNWDLVDISAPHLLGDYLLNYPNERDINKEILFKLAKKNDLWENRIAILSTFAFIRNNHYKDFFKIADLLINHKHDLIHKALGWMLREIWKRNNLVAEKYIKDNYDKLPRTTLRYAIEKMDEKKRKSYLKGKF